MAPDRTRVLVPGDELTGTLAAVRALRAGGYEPWLLVVVPHTFAARSRAVAGVVTAPDPDTDADGYVRAIAAAARRLGAGSVLPANESSLVLLAGRDDLFDDAVALGSPGAEIVARATDKNAVLALAHEVGIASPPTLSLALADVGGDVPLPAIVKPSRTKLTLPDGRMAYFKAKRVGTIEELRATLAQLPREPWVVQPYLAGALEAVAGVAWQGELVCAEHQVARRIWPLDAGFSSYAETVAPDRGLERRLGDLLGRLEWSGIWEAQFLRSGGERYLIDFNPRVYGSMALAVAAGHNLPAIWLDLLHGGRPSPGPYRVGVGYRYEQNDIRAIVAARAWSGLVPRPGTTHAVFSLRDPKPLLVISAKKLVARAQRRKQDHVAEVVPPEQDHRQPVDPEP
jgi:predicted ATP-grasp superfamily ATP-dependent carboligase